MKNEETSYHAFCEEIKGLTTDRLWVIRCATYEGCGDVQRICQELAHKNELDPGLTLLILPTDMTLEDLPLETLEEAVAKIKAARGE